MIFPSKFSQFDDSILAKISYLIVDDVKEIHISELMAKRISKFNDVSEFVAALDVLYVLGKIDLDVAKRIIHYVD